MAIVQTRRNPPKTSKRTHLPKSRPGAKRRAKKAARRVARERVRKHRRRIQSRLRRRDIHQFVASLVGEDMHAKRVLSLSNALTGTVHAATLGIHAIGQALAQVAGLNPKHAVKQVDRLLSNAKVAVPGFFARWIPFILGARPEAYLALDWTEFDADDHATIALYLITSHGRATPLLWKTVVKSELEGWRNEHEDVLLTLFARLRPESLQRVTVLADRGFGDQKLYPFLQELGLDYIVRFRGLVHVENATGECHPAADWVLPTGRPRLIRDAKVTSDKTPVPAVVCVHATGMKEAWCLATSRADLKAAQITAAYGKRFRIEETFRDCKDLRFGMGLKATHIGSPERRDRLLLVAAMAQALLTLLGAAAESIGLDRMLKANTVKHRTHSLFRQGCYWYGAIPAMPRDRLVQLMRAFGALVAEQPVFTTVFGAL